MDSLRSDAHSRSPMPSVPPVVPAALTNDDIEAVIQMATSARSSPDGRNGPPRDTRTQLFVGNLPYRVRWQDLKDLFRQAGTVLRADVSLGPDNRSRGYGTVLLATAEDAGRAVDKFNGYSWQTRILEVRPDRLPPDFDSAANGSLPDFDTLSLYGLDRPTSSTGGKNLFVGNLPFHCQWQDLKDLFRQAGTIVRADVALGQDGRSRGFGTVVFATEYDADRAVKMFNGYEYNGRLLKVHYDKFSPSTTTPASPSIPAFGQPLGSAYVSHPSHITFSAGYLDFSAPSTPYDIYPPQLQMSMPHPHHTHSHIHQPSAAKDPVRPSLSVATQDTSSSGSSAESLRTSSHSTTASSTSTPPCETGPTTSPQNSHTAPSVHHSHPHHPGPISIPPPPPATSFTMQHYNLHQMSALISPMYHPISPLHHGPVPMTPHGLPPITPSMPPFTFLPSFGQPLKTSDSDMNGYHHIHYPMASSSLAQTVPMTPTTPSPPLDGNSLAAALATGESSSSLDSTSFSNPNQHKKTSPARRQMHSLQAPHLTPFSPGLAMSPGAFWGRNPYMNPAPGAPVNAHPYQGSPHMYPIPSPGMFPVPSPGGFTLHPQASPGGFFFAGPMVEPKGYFDSVMSMSSLATNGSGDLGGTGYFGGSPTVEGEILRDKKKDTADEKLRKGKDANPLQMDDFFSVGAKDPLGPSRTHSMSSTGEKRPTMAHKPDSVPARITSKRAVQSPDEL